jgi:hypothetical protein
METVRNAIALVSVFVIPLILVGFPLYGLAKRVPVYETFVEGAKEGFQVAVRIIPYLVAILFAVAMFRASGAMDFLVRILDPVLRPIGFPAEVLPMAIVRPLTGSGSAALVVDMINRYGDHLLRDRGVLRRGEHQEEPPRGRGRAHGGHLGDDHRGLAGAAALRLIILHRMRYLLLIYGDERAWDDETRESCYRESAELAHQLKAEGYYLGASPLQPVATATSIRVRQGKRLRTDGPFAETREQLGGYFLVEANTLDEAVEIAGRLPGARVGTVEVRPVMEVGGLPED